MLLRDAEKDVFETLNSELSHLAVYCGCEKCPELPLNLRKSLYDARIQKKCSCGEVGCRALYFVHDCADNAISTISFSMPGFHALALAHCSAGHVLDVDWLEDHRPSRA